MSGVDKIRKFYVDCDSDININTDDFIVAVGKKRSNSVYHVVESRKEERPNGFRFYVKVLKTDLITCLKRELCQSIFPVVWHSRNRA